MVGFLKNSNYLVIFKNLKINKMVKSNQVALGVRVKLNENFEVKCIGDNYLKEEPIIFISESKPYNDQRGEYVMLRGGSLTNSCYAYLDQLDLEFPVPNSPLYTL